MQDWPWLVVGLLLAALIIIIIIPPPRHEGVSAVFRVFALAYLAIIAVVTPFTVAQGIDSRYLVPVHVPLLFIAAFWLDGLLRRRASGKMAMAAARWSLVALALLAAAGHTGVSVRQNLRLTAEALESGYIGRTFNTAYWEDSELMEYLRSNPVSGRHYSNEANLLRWNAGVAGTLVSRVSVPRRGLRKVYDCQRWFELAVRQSRQHREPEKYVV